LNVLGIAAPAAKAKAPVAKAKAKATHELVQEEDLADDANHLGFKNVMVSAQEMDMIVKHRAGLIKAKINTDPSASAPVTAVEPTVQALD
jgi:hypothetical protein